LCKAEAGKEKRPGVAGAFRNGSKDYFLAGTEVVVAPDVVVVVVAVDAMAASGAVLVVVVVVVLEVSSTTFGASTLTSGFFSSGLLQATREVATATRARADMNFFISVCSLLVD